MDEVANLATWAMTLVIQRAEHRDTQATHAKLDEILHALGDARNEVTKMDENEPETSSNGESTCARTISRCWAPIALSVSSRNVLARKPRPFDPAAGALRWLRRRPALRPRGRGNGLRRRASIRTLFLLSQLCRQDKALLPLRGSIETVSDFGFVLF